MLIAAILVVKVNHFFSSLSNDDHIYNCFKNYCLVGFHQDNVINFISLQ